MIGRWGRSALKHGRRSTQEEPLSRSGRLSTAPCHIHCHTRAKGKANTDSGFLCYIDYSQNITHEAEPLVHTFRQIASMNIKFYILLHGE